MKAMPLDLSGAAAQCLRASLSGRVCHSGQMTSFLEQVSQGLCHRLTLCMLMKLLSQDLFPLSEQYEPAIHEFSFFFFFFHEPFRLCLLSERSTLCQGILWKIYSEHCSLYWQCKDRYFDRHTAGIEIHSHPKPAQKSHS